jgi:hypothetical protein
LVPDYAEDKVGGQTMLFGLFEVFVQRRRGENLFKTITATCLADF